MGEWAGLGYYARARNLLKCARAVVADHGGVFPDTREGLLTLPGIGPYTAAAIAAIAFGRAETVVDGNVERVMARLHDIHTPLPGAKPELTAAAAALTPATRPGDYAQAVMDLGATICTPRNPGLRHLPVARSLPRAGARAPPPICRARRRRRRKPVAARHRLCRAARGWGVAAGDAAPIAGFWAGCWAGRGPTGSKACQRKPRR